MATNYNIYSNNEIIERLIKDTAANVQKISQNG